MPHAQEAIRVDGHCLAFRSDGRDRLRLDRGRDECMCSCSDEDLPRYRGLLEPSGHVDGITRDQRLAGSCHDLARVHPRSGGKVYAVLARQVVVEDSEPLTELDGRATRTQGVVFVCLRNTEDGHYRVADEFLDCPAVTLERGTRLFEVAAQQTPHRLRVEPLSERCGSGQVVEDDRHRSPLTRR